MKTILHFPFQTGALILLTATALLTSCGSDKDDAPAPAPNANTPATPQPKDADGILAAVNVKIPSPVIVPGAPTEIVMGTAVAAFFSATGGSTYQEAGAVSLNTKALTKNPNKTYTYQPSQTDVTGLDFSGGVNWSVAGEGNVPPINKTVPGGMPQSANITSAPAITKASGYTFTIDPVSTGDSILFVISSVNNTSVYKTTHRSATSVNFTAAELSGLANSDQAIMQANVYTISSEMFGGKKFYFVNQASTNVTAVKIQ